MNTITHGSHGRHYDLDPDDHQLAHYYDPFDPEGVPNQCHNFLTYAGTMPECDSPIILIAPTMPEDQVEADTIRIQMTDWRQIVETATGKFVQIQ